MWLFVCCLYREFYLQIFKCVSFWLHSCCGEWEGGPVNEVNHTSWVAVVTPTDRPKSVRNCCLIELFCGVVCVVTLPFWHFCWCRGFCHRNGSALLLFVSSIISNVPHFGSPHFVTLFVLSTTNRPFVKSLSQIRRLAATIYIPSTSLNKLDLKYCLELKHLSLECQQRYIIKSKHNKDAGKSKNLKSRG